MVRHVIVANEIDTSATTFNDITGGYLGIFSESPAGAVALLGDTGTITAFPRLCFVRGKGTGDSANKFVYLKGTDVISWRNKKYTVGVKKVITVGYQGSGTENIPLTRYNIKEYALFVHDLTPTSDPTRRIKPGKTYSVTSAGSDATLDQGRYNIAVKLINAINNDPNSIVYADIIHGEATIVALTGNATVVHGSNIVTATNTLGSVGDFLSLKGVLYKILVENSTTSFTIDRPYAGVSETITAGTTVATEAGFIAAATIVGTTLLGYIFTAKDYDHDFSIEVDVLSGFDSGEYIATTTELTYSHGVSTLVIADEKSVEGWEGSTNRVNIPDNVIRYAAAGTTYDCYQIDYMEEAQGHDGIHETNRFKQTLTFWFAHAAAANVTTYFGDNATPGYVEDWLITTPGSGSFVDNI